MSVTLSRQFIRDHHDYGIATMFFFQFVPFFFLVIVVVYINAKSKGFHSICLRLLYASVVAFVTGCYAGHLNTSRLIFAFAFHFISFLASQCNYFCVNISFCHLYRDLIKATVK